MLPTKIIDQLAALKKRRQEVIKMLALERARLDSDCLVVQKDIKNHLYFLERSVAVLAEEISRTVRSSCIWR